MLNLSNHLNSILNQLSIIEINFSVDPQYGLYLNFPWYDSKSNIEVMPCFQWTSLEEFMNQPEENYNCDIVIGGQYVFFKGKKHFISYKNCPRKYIYDEILFCKNLSNNIFYNDRPNKFAWEKLSEKSLLFLNLLAECSSIEEFELKLAIHIPS